MLIKKLLLFLVIMFQFMQSKGQVSGITSTPSNEIVINSALTLHWEIVSDEIILLLDTTSQGYAGIGFGTAMSNADYIITIFNGGSNVPTVKDYGKVSGYQQPQVQSNDKQNVVFLEYNVSGTRKKVKFKRKLNTQDSNENVLNANSAQYLIWALGNSPGSFGYHSSRGSVQLWSTVVTTVSGCTTSTACNYNSAATQDDGSCKVNDCKNVCGGNSVLDACQVCGGDGSTCATSAQEVKGCTTSTACNYNSAANKDDGSCKTLDDCQVCGGDGSTCKGCTTSTACNYNSTATKDDGSCKVLDCMDVCGGNSTCLSMSAPRNIKNFLLDILFFIIFLKNIL